jgi:hypothetical protein
LETVTNGVGTFVSEFMVEYPDEDATPDDSLPEIGEINGGELLKPGP